ncbi:MAG TPA: cupin-like domain-containing protein [Polyangiaceae bacterium]|nr:cupin-like domain-containing protein [Polyangiaceae bacterium]
MAKRRSKRSKKPATELSPEWRVWIAENLALGRTVEQVDAALAEQGVPARERRRRVAEIAESPALIEARRAHVEQQRISQIVRLLREQRRLSGVEVPRVSGLDADAFFSRYYATNTPVILTDYVTEWPAFERWTPAHFGERYGELLVSVAEGRDSDPNYDQNTDRLTVTMPMKELVARVQAAGESNDFYMVARNRNLQEPHLAVLFDALKLDRGLLDREQIVGACQLWFGPKGTVTPLHHDTSNILFCQVYGEKRIRLASPLETDLLEGARAMYSAVDPEATGPDGGAASEVPFSDVTLAAGEALFIPVGWWHHVRALSVSISVALNCFARDNKRAWYCPGAIR